MPYITITTNKTIDKDLELELKKGLGELIEIFNGKTEKWLMLNINDNMRMWFNGSKEECVMIGVEVYGNMTDKESGAFTTQVTDLVSSKLCIDKDRIYVKYFQTDKWGWNGNNFN